ncbi:TlpA family protein disulfide reductase [Natrinema longum]|uniref:TlpA family protein disulfide reductase n=1 Tax=Natrinema longum TaxID=370324 RepID=A0A8A2U9I0_9EURY|nr:TlpA disulfide reductase family protein [Natrinema longum]MBZ6496764.1 TlpA family protein disulfide reductase [Natrinema longum]QSW85346.1 TlpA family protein disulfide reductase [Natrinema longum]
MRRREVIVGTAGLAALGGGAIAVSEWNPRESGAAVDSIELETIDAPGSEAGTATVPERGRVTFVELFATWCSVCQDMMEPLGQVHDDIDADVQFVSATGEPIGNTITREDVADWWREHDGTWPVALDADLELTEALDASGVPYAFVLDADNVVTWSGRGRKSPDEIRSAIDDAGGE